MCLNLKSCLSFCLRRNKGQMRTRSSSLRTPEIKLDSPMEQHGKSTGGKRFTLKLPKLRRNTKSHTNVSDVLDTSSVYKPLKEELTFEQNLEQLNLSEAGLQLIDREERLFGHIITEETVTLKQQEKEEQLSKDRGALLSLVEQTFKESLKSEKINVVVLKSAVNAVRHEEQQDEQWKERVQTSPVWRPSRWRQLHDSALQSMVEERMDNAPIAPGQGEQTSIQRDACAMGKLLKEDLLRVVDVVKGCYPAEMDVCNLYAKMYHQAFSSRLRKIAEFGLGEKDCASLLRWVNDFYPDILKKQELTEEINCEALGKLLPEELSAPLETQYLTNTQGEVKNCIDRILREAEQTWMGGAEPEYTDDYYCSPMAIDVVQLIDGAVRSVEVILGDQRKARLIMCLLEDFLQSFKKFQDGVMKGSKANSRPVVMANLVCVEQFRDYIVKKADLFPEDVKEICLSVVIDMKQSGNSYLLSPLHKKLKPQYRNLGTSDWLKTPLFEELSDSIEEHTRDLKGLSETCHQELMCQLQLDVTVEYVKRLLKGKVKLKDKEMQEKAARTVTENGQRLHSLFVKAGSTEGWLSDVLPKIAEVLKLQDLPSMQMEIASLGTTYPDLSEKHVSALLKLKTNLSRANRKKVKAALTDRLVETNVEDARAFFSRVEVK